MRLMKAAALVATAGLILLLWHWASTAFKLQLYLSTPADVFAYMVLNSRPLLTDFLVTFCEASAGYILAILAGMLVTLVAFILPPLRRPTTSVLSALQVIPLIVFAPLLIAMFGYGLGSKVAMSFLFVFVSFTIGSISAYSTIPASYHDLVRSLSLSPVVGASRVYLPLTLPALFASMKVCAGLAVLGAVVAEFTGAQYGLGKNIFVSTTRLEPQLMWASVALTGAAGGILTVAVSLLERRFGRWYL